MEKLKCLTIIDNKMQVQEITNDFREMQKIVGGHFDIAYRKIGDKPYIIYVNDTGLIDGLPPSIKFTNDRNNNYLFGNAIIAKGGEEGDTLPLTDNDITHIKSCMRLLKLRSVIRNINFNVYVFKGGY